MQKSNIVNWYILKLVGESIQKDNLICALYKLNTTISFLLKILMVENLVAKRAECEFKPMEGIEGNE